MSVFTFKCETFEIYKLAKETLHLKALQHAVFADKTFIHTLLYTHNIYTSM